jgi:YVTN family beta-propeller protein
MILVIASVAVGAYIAHTQSVKNGSTTSVSSTIFPETTTRSSTLGSNLTNPTSVSGSTPSINFSQSISNGSSNAVPSLTSIELDNLSVGSSPAEIGFNPDTKLIYVSDLDTSNLTVVNASTHSVVATIELQSSPQLGIAVDPIHNMIYVPVIGCLNMQVVTNSCQSNSSSSYHNAGILRINASTNKILGEIQIAVNHLAINPTTGTLWGLASASLYAIDASSGALVANISLHAAPVSLALNTKTNTIYVAACAQLPLTCQGAEVLGFSGDTRSLKTNMSLANFDALNFELTVDPSANRVFTMGETGQNLTLVSIDGSSGKLLYSVSIAASCTGAGGGTLSFDNASNELIVTFFSTQLLLFINSTNGQIGNMVSTGGGVEFAYSNSNTQQLYLTVNNSLLFLSGKPTQSYVDLALLSNGICLP